MAFGALRENIEDQAVPIDDARFQRLLKITLLARRQNVIENHELDAIGHHGLLKFLDLTAAHVHLGIGTGALAGQADNWHRTGAFGEQAEFFETGVEIDLAEIYANECCKCSQMSGQIGRSKKGKTAGSKHC